MRAYSAILVILFTLLMIIWLVKAVFLTKDGDYQVKSYCLLWANLSCIMSMWHSNLRRQS